MQRFPRLTLVASVAFAAFVVPTMAHAQKAATVCKDGTTSAVSGRGACSGHGGVSATATKAEKQTVKKEEKAAAATSKTTHAPVAPAAASAKSSAKSSVAGSGGGDDDNAAGAIAKCKDGKYSHAATHKGACSRHGGVGQWMTK